ncbi:MAG: hypothetical protein R3228_10475 [Halioglobus sp.]|nr:hypothetical protein [Halioglobus sp.]
MLVDPLQEPITETSLAVYFKEQLSEHAAKLSPEPQEDTCWYIGSMLERFGRSEDFFAYSEGAYELRPLALLYGDALEAPSERERCLLLQQLGDMALFLGALFPERFTRLGIQQDYVAGMGGSAYDYLADNAGKNRHVFAELASAFHHMLELVANACSRNRLNGSEDIIALYQHWSASGDPIAANRLRAIGVKLDGSSATH